MLAGAPVPPPQTVPAAGSHRRRCSCIGGSTNPGPEVLCMTAVPVLLEPIGFAPPVLDVPADRIPVWLVVAVPSVASHIDGSLEASDPDVHDGEASMPERPEAMNMMV